MKDRVPKYPGRVTLTPVPGQTNTYDMARADEPIVTGDALNKANLLPDAVAQTLGLTQENPQVKDAFLAVLRATGKGSVIIHAYTVTGSAYSGIKINGMPIDDSLSYTDRDGVLIAYVDAGTYTLTSDADGKYIDCEMTSRKITVVAGNSVHLDWRERAKEIQRINILTTTSLMFSKNVSEIDVFCVGGGGSGAWNSSGSSSAYSGGGGGGYTQTGLHVEFEPEITYPAIVGAGAQYSENVNQGNEGGATSLLGVVAKGGKGGGYRTGGDGGSGGACPGGKGGSDGSDASGSSYSPGNGQGTTTRPFGDTSEKIAYAGGGGARDAMPGELGGGAYCEDGDANTGGGGGGGGTSANQHGGSGGSGIIIVRWRSKTA